MYVPPNRSPLSTRLTGTYQPEWTTLQRVLPQKIVTATQKTAENIRYGQNISESGMGGFTNSTGEAKKEGAYGGAARDEDLEKSKTDARAAQGYGSGSGVGG